MESAQEYKKNFNTIEDRGVKLPENTFTLLVCNSLAPKDVFCEQFLWSKLLEGRKCVFAAVDDPVPKIVRDKMMLKEWDVRPFEEHNRLVLIDVFKGEESTEKYTTTTIHKSTESTNAPREMNDLVLKIIKAESPVDTVIFDSLTIPFLLSDDPYNIICFLFDWIERCRNFKMSILASLLEGTVPKQVENLLISLADNVLYLDQENKEPNFMVKKWYGGKKSSLSLKYSTDTSGILRW